MAVEKKLSPGKKSETSIVQVEENNDNSKTKKQKAKIKLKSPSLGVVTKRQGGGTIIESRPFFSDDVKYIYVNCGWGLRAFSVKTGESTRVYDAFTKNGNVVGSILYNSHPSAITSNGYFITWEGKSGKVLNKYKILLPDECSATNAYLVTSLNNAPAPDLCITVRPNISKNIAIYFFNPENGKKLNHPLNGTVVTNINSKHNISFGGPPDATIIASINTKGLNVYSLDGNNSKLRLAAGNTRTWTCVRCHPTEVIVAAGDNTGRIVVYTNIFQSLCDVKPHAVYHWHTLACQEIAFSPIGSTMYSGGGEHVLVKWNLENPQVRYFLPRLSADIVHINISSDNQLVAVATLDNAIQVVEPPIRLKCVLQQLAWGVLPTPKSILFPAGLIYEPRNRSIALNGRPGHLQFYSPLSEAMILSLDVTLQNYITQERNKVIINTEVTHVAITNDGAWLATMETRDDPGVTLELRLKFWQYINSKKSFNLNTSVELPHDGKAFTILFQPCTNKLSNNDDINFDYLLATTGDDKKFRLWAPHDLDSIYRKGMSWKCENTCYYRGYNCGPASFSEDGSLMAVGFGPSITVWDVDSVKLKESLTNSEDDIKLISFGMKECGHLLVTTTQDVLFVWNLLTVRLSWKVPICASILTVDSCSSYMAVFSTDNQLYVFTPMSTEPVYESKNVCNRKGQVLSAVFMPRERSFLEGPHWLQNSLLYYIDSNQELICFESEEESGEISMLKLAHDNDPGTLFSTLIAAQQTSDIQKIKTDNKTQHFGILGSAAVTQLLQAPAHTMPPVSLLCSSLLQSLVLTKKSYEKEKKKNNKEVLSDEEEKIKESESDSDTSSERMEKDSGPNSDEEKEMSIENTMNLSDEEPADIKQMETDDKSNSTASNFINELLDDIDNTDGLFVIHDD